MKNILRSSMVLPNRINENLFICTQLICRIELKMSMSCLSFALNAYLEIEISRCWNIPFLIFLFLDIQKYICIYSVKSKSKFWVFDFDAFDSNCSHILMLQSSHSYDQKAAVLVCTLSLGCIRMFGFLSFYINKFLGNR